MKLKKWLVALAAAVVVALIFWGGCGGHLLWLVVLSVPVLVWGGKETACPECGKWFKRKTTSDTRTVSGTERNLVHGRITKKGKFDQRYNNTVRISTRGIRHLKFECSACDHRWEKDEPFHEHRDERV